MSVPNQSTEEQRQQNWQTGVTTAGAAAGTNVGLAPKVVEGAAITDGLLKYADAIEQADSGAAFTRAITREGFAVLIGNGTSVVVDRRLHQSGASSLTAESTGVGAGFGAKWSYVRIYDTAERQGVEFADSLDYFGFRPGVGTFDPTSSEFDLAEARRARINRDLDAQLAANRRAQQNRTEPSSGWDAETYEQLQREWAARAQRTANSAPDLDDPTNPWNQNRFDPATSNGTVNSGWDLAGQNRRLAEALGLTEPRRGGDGSGAASPSGSSGESPSGSMGYLAPWQGLPPAPAPASASSASSVSAASPNSSGSNTTADDPNRSSTAGVYSYAGGTNPNERSATAYTGDYGSRVNNGAGNGGGGYVLTAQFGQGLDAGGIGADGKFYGGSQWNASFKELDYATIQRFRGTYSERYNGGQAITDAEVIQIVYFNYFRGNFVESAWQGSERSFGGAGVSAAASMGAVGDALGQAGSGSEIVPQASLPPPRLGIESTAAQYRYIPSNQSEARWLMGRAANVNYAITTNSTAGTSAFYAQMGYLQQSAERGRTSCRRRALGATFSMHDLKRQAPRASSAQCHRWVSAMPTLTDIDGNPESHWGTAR